MNLRILATLALSVATCSMGATGTQNLNDDAETRAPQHKDFLSVNVYGPVAAEKSTIFGDELVGGNLLVTRDTTIGGDLAVEGDITVAGSIDLSGDLDVDGNLGVTGTVTVTGGITLLANSLTIPAGSEAAPSLNFASNTTNGMYSSPTAMGFVADGANRFVVAANYVQTNTTLRVVYGTETLPGITFVGDADTGLYRAALNTIGFATDGAEQATISDTALISQNPIQIPDGSAAAPSLVFETASSSGIYNVSLGAMGFARAGDLKLIVGNTFVETSTFLRVIDGTASAPSIVFSSDTDTGVYRKSGNTIGFSTSGAERASLAASALILQERIQVPQGTATAPVYTFSQDTSSGMYHLAETGQIGFTADQVTELVITKTGLRVPNISLKTISPAYVLGFVTAIKDPATTILNFPAAPTDGDMYLVLNAHGDSLALTLDAQTGNNMARTGAQTDVVSTMSTVAKLFVFYGNGVTPNAWYEVGL